MNTLIDKDIIVMKKKSKYAILNIKELNNLPPIDKKTEVILRALANAMIDRVIEDHNSGKHKKYE